MEDEMKIEQRDIGTVTPYPGNPRNNDKAIVAVVESIRQFGFRQPVVVDSAGVIIVGHSRFEAAKRIGLKVIPVHVAADLSEEQANAYRLADNRAHDFSFFDPVKLNQELEKITEIDLSVFDFGKLTEEVLGTNITDGLKQVKVTRPLKMGWVLVGVPLGSFDQIQELVDRATKITGSIVETTCNG